MKTRGDRLIVRISGDSEIERDNAWKLRPPDLIDTVLNAVLEPVEKDATKQDDVPVVDCNITVAGEVVHSISDQEIALGPDNWLRGLDAYMWKDLLGKKTGKAVKKTVTLPETYQKEDYRGNVNPIGPRSAYDESKRFAEALTMAYNRIHGIPTRIARIFNTYGPRMRVNDGRVLPSFMASALRGEDIIVHGDGTQTRSFCYVSDLVEGLCRLMDSDERMPINLGNPGEITILQFAEEIIEVTGSESKITFEENPIGDDPMRRRPDISRAKELLGWEPDISRGEGLRKTLEYFKKELSGL